MNGLTTEQMADQLGVQRSTARTHVQSLLPSSACSSAGRWPRSRLLTLQRDLADPRALTRTRSRAPDVDTAPTSDGPRQHRGGEAFRMQHKPDCAGPDKLIADLALISTECPTRT